MSRRQGASYSPHPTYMHSPFVLRTAGKEYETVKLYLSADIEGTAGIDTWDETEIGKEKYVYFARQMTREVSAAVEGAELSGYETTVKDAHDSARNLDPAGLPRSARLIRGWTRDLFCMMGGLDQDRYDAVAFTGYHSGATGGGNPLSHTMSTSVQRVRINGELASEFTINAYMAGLLGIPVVFLSGDEALCRAAEAMIPGIATVASKTGMGGAVLSRHPDVVCDDIRRTVQAALSALHQEPDRRAACLPVLPPRFEMEVEYKDWNQAHRLSFYPGAASPDPQTVTFASSDYREVMRFMHFCL